MSFATSAWRDVVWRFTAILEQCLQFGNHLGYYNRTILAILNSFVPLMSSKRFQLNLTCCLGGDVVWRFSRWPSWRPSWISEGNDVSNTDSLCHSDVSHQVSTQSDLCFGRKCLLKNFKMVAMAKRNDFSNSESLLSLWCLRLNQTYCLGGNVARRISRWLNNFSNSESPCRHNASHQVSAQSDLRF